MFGMWDVEDVGCSGCGMLAGMWDVDLQNAVMKAASHDSIGLEKKELDC